MIWPNEGLGGARFSLALGSLLWNKWNGVTTCTSFVIHVLLLHPFSGLWRVSSPVCALLLYQD